MIITNTVRQALADEFDLKINTATPPADLIFETVADVALVTCALNNPAFGNATTAGVLTLDVTPAVSGTATAAGDTVQASIFDGAAAKMCEFTVNDTGTPEISISNNTIAVSDVVQVTSLTVTMPAS